MFGTIFTLKPKAGKEHELLDLFERWDHMRRQRIKGALASHLYRSTDNPKEWMCAVVFDSRENYFANAEDPEQDLWYRELVSLLEEEPRWMDGEVLLSYMEGSGVRRTQPTQT